MGNRMRSSLAICRRNSVTKLSALATIWVFRLGLAGFRLFGCFTHGTRQAPAFVMLREHDANRPTLAGNTSRFHSWEELAFFFLMVATIGESLDEIRSVDEEARTNGQAASEAGGRGLKAVQDALDDTMFLHQLLRSFHECPPVATSAGLQSPGRSPAGSGTLYARRHSKSTSPSLQIESLYAPSQF